VEQKYTQSRDKWRGGGEWPILFICITAKVEGSDFIAVANQYTVNFLCPVFYTCQFPIAAKSKITYNVLAHG